MRNKLDPDIEKYHFLNIKTARNIKKHFHHNQINGIKLAFLFLPTLYSLNAQPKYWLPNELPENLRNNLPEPAFCSDWLSHCSYRLNKEQICLLDSSQIPYSVVNQYEPLAHPLNEITMGFALEQIDGQVFRERGLTGKGVKIGIIDGGFLHADTDPSLHELFARQQVGNYTDYITPNLADYEGSSGLDDAHGTNVWQLIGGFHPEKNILYGLATEATYYLARTDHGGYEKRIEEDLLIQALEDMQQQGIRLVNISLGYSEDFNNPEENHLALEMDGTTTALSRAVEIAATKKGMLIVVAAGNDGMTDWKTVSVPADAEHALTVGASKWEVWDKMDFSSTGPEFTSFVKPDLAVYATGGTSFAAPVVTGIAACMWQYDTTLTNVQIINLLQQAGHFYPYPNNYVGYGVPLLPRLWQLMQGESISKVQKLTTTKNHLKIRDPSEATLIIAYHKKDQRNVIKREVYPTRRHTVKIKRIPEASCTSVMIGRNVMEINWQ